MQNELKWLSITEEIVKHKVMIHPSVIQVNGQDLFCMQQYVEY